MGSKKSKKKKSRKAKKILLLFLSILMIVVLGSTAYLYNTLGKIKTTKISKNNSDLGITELPPSQANKDITNIALFGVDNRPGEDVGRSDAIIVLSVDNLHKKVKLSSLMRDSYVNIDGHGKTKLNHAYAYGGPELAIKTINENFGLNIKDYATINFQSMEKLIDEVGGVEITLTPEEIKYLNNYASDQAAADGTKLNKITEPGKQLLSGNQALAYTRIRYTASGDFGRTDRQRTVLTALLNKIVEEGPMKFPSLVSTLAPYIETSMSQLEILKLGSSAYSSGTLNFDQQRFPTDLNCENLMIDGVFYLGFDEAVTKKELHNYIYDDVKPDYNPLNVDNNNDYIKDGSTNKNSSDNTSNTTVESENEANEN